MYIKILHLKVTQEIHTAIKVRAAEQGMTMNAYLVSLVEAAVNASIPKERNDKLDSDLRQAALNPRSLNYIPSKATPVDKLTDFVPEELHKTFPRNKKKL